MNFLQKSKKIIAVATLLSGLALFAGCGGQKAEEAISGTVSASGSTALLPLLKPVTLYLQHCTPTRRRSRLTV